MRCQKTFFSSLLLSIVFACSPSLIFARQSPSASQTIIAGLSMDDDRLTQKVTVHVEGIPVGDLLALVSQKTGVTLAAEKDIADEKIILFMPARPLRDTLYDIAALFNNHWERLDPDKTLNKASDKPQSDSHVQLYRYRMVRGVRAREYEDALANEPVQRMKAQLDQQVDQLVHSRDDVLNRPPTERFRRNLLDPERRLATQVYASLDAQQKEQLFTQGCTNSLPFASLSPDEQQALEQWVGYHNVREQQHAGQGDALEPSAIEHQWLHTAGIRMVLSSKSAHEIEVGVQMPRNTFLLAARLHDSATHPLARHANPYTGKAVTAGMILPPIEITKLREQTDWTDRLSAFAKASQLPVLSDYFRTDTLSFADTSNVLPNILSNKVQGMALLDALSASGNRVWWQRGSSLLLRSEEWYRLRRYEVPDRWIEELIGSIRAHGGKPTYGDLLRLLELTSQQMEGLGMMYGIWRPSIDQFREAAGQRTMLELVQACGLDTTRSLLVTEEPPLSTEPVDYDQPGAKRPVDFETLYVTVPQSARSAVDAVYAMNYIVNRTCEEPFRMYAYARYPRFSNPPQQVEKNFLRVVLHLSGTLPASLRPARLQGWMSAANVEQHVFVPMALPHQRQQKTEIVVSP